MEAVSLAVSTHTNFAIVADSATNEILVGAKKGKASSVLGEIGVYLISASLIKSRSSL